MPKLRNSSKGDSNPSSLDCESGILRLSYRTQNPHRSLHLITLKTICRIHISMFFDMTFHKKNPLQLRYLYINYEYDHSFDLYNVLGQLMRFSVHFKVERILNCLTSKDNSMFGELVLSLCYSF